MKRITAGQIKILCIGSTNFINDLKTLGAVLKQQIIKAAIGLETRKMLTINRMVKTDFRAIAPLPLIVPGVVLLEIAVCTKVFCRQVGIMIVVFHCA